MKRHANNRSNSERESSINNVLINRINELERRVQVLEIKVDQIATAITDEKERLNYVTR